MGFLFGRPVIAKAGSAAEGRQLVVLREVVLGDPQQGLDKECQRACPVRTAGAVEIDGPAFAKPTYNGSECLLIQFLGPSRSPSKVLLKREFQILGAVDHGSDMVFTFLVTTKVKVDGDAQILEENLLPAA